MFPVHAANHLGAGGHHPLVQDLIIPAGIVAVGSMLALVGMCRVVGDRITLRDSSEALSFIQDLTDLLGMILNNR